MPSDAAKKEAAKAALPYLQNDMIVGIGSGSTVAFFIELLATFKHRIQGAVSSSSHTTLLLKAQGISVLDLNAVGPVDVYIDSADEVNPQQQLLKGGGGALTREKIIAACAKQFICLVHQAKRVQVLGKFPLPIEVIPMARSYVAREIVKIGGNPAYRQGFLTDNGNHILDIHGLQIVDPKTLETTLNQITGTVCNGLFAHRPADVLIVR